MTTGSQIIGLILLLLGVATGVLSFSLGNGDPEGDFFLLLMGFAFFVAGLSLILGAARHPSNY